MKATFSAALVFILLISFIPWGIRTNRISVLGQPEFLTKLTSATPFDFPQQWRKTKKDSDDWLHSEERFNAGNQGVEPLWACVYNREDYNPEQPIIRAASDGGLFVGTTYLRSSSFRLTTGVLKLSSYSSIELQQFYGPDFPVSMFNCVEQTNDGGYIMGMRADLTDGFLINKLYPNGDIEWSAYYSNPGRGAEEVHSIKQTSDGGYIVVGITTSFKHPYFDDPEWDFDVNLLVIKLSPKGDIEWRSAFGGSKHESEWALKDRKATILESSHGGYLVVCDTRSFSENRWPDLWVVKLSDFGDIEWQRVFGGEQSELLKRPGPYAVETSDGKYIIACTTWSYGVVNQETNSRFSEMWLIKLKPNGDVEWQKTYGEKGSEIVRALQATSDGGCIVAGGSNSWSGSNNPDALVFKLSPTGNILWQHTYGGKGHDEATSVCITSDNGIGIAGSTYSFAIGEEGLLVLKLTSDGKLDPVCTDLVADPEIVVMDTNCIPLDTYEVARVIDVVKTTSKIKTESLNLKKNLVCWNLNQPPVNLHFERQENKSFFASEAWNTITWSPNPYNSQFSITDYKIYRKNTDYETFPYKHIATVPANINLFVDSKEKTGMDEEARYLYVVTSVDSEGNESPRSEAVGNMD